MEYCFNFKLPAFEKELEIILAKNKVLNNKEGKLLSNMIKVADLSKKFYKWRYIYSYESKNCIALG